MRKYIKRLLEYFGYELVKHYRADPKKPFCKIPISESEVVDLDSLSSISLTIPGMISPGAGQLLYTMCYMQEMDGDVVEIGSWQGRSSSFLARAVKSSGNGKFYAIDHFEGNKGKESNYTLANVSSLKEGFVKNIQSLGLTDTVNLLDMPNTKAKKELENSRIRFLFIDGDHTEDGVRTDVELFFPNLVPGAIVVFDDFSAGFSGVVKVVDELLKKKLFGRVMVFKNTFVLKVL
jgi:predicted O-methyltransferase YrrM